ncbi:MAG: PEP-CTERM sorting domain-containing protein [Phycisphaerae bacterium]|nr:PEP-CTERM sorting domain-containing protein [Phycisphaerae bacterium]
MKTVTINVLVICALTAVGSATTVTPQMDSLAIYAGKDIWLGSGSSVDADIAAVGSITTGTKVGLKGLYTESLVWLNKDNKINGRVLANLAAEASSGLEFTGPSWTGKSVSMGKGANVTGDIIAGAGNLSLDDKAYVLGNLNSNADIWIDNYGVITGNADPGEKGKLSVGRKVSIGGSTDPSVAYFDTVRLDSMGPAPEKKPHGTEDISGGRKAVVDLTAGEYQNLNLWGTDTKLNLSAGTYNLRDVWIGNRGTVNVDTTAGDVVLDVHKNFAVGNEVAFNVIGDGQLTVNVFDENVILGDDVTLAAQIRAWTGDVNTGDDLAFAGTIHAYGDASFGGGSVVSYQKQIPEPGTILLLGIGAFVILWEERRKHRHPRVAHAWMRL